MLKLYFILLLYLLFLVQSKVYTKDDQLKSNVQQPDSFITSEIQISNLLDSVFIIRKQFPELYQRIYDSILKISLKYNYKNCIADNYFYRAKGFLNDNNIDSSLKYLNLSYNYYKSLNQNKLCIPILENIGYLNNLLNNDKIAIQNYEELNKYYLIEDNKQKISNNYIILGNLNLKNGKYYAAMELYFKALEYAEITKEQQLIADCYVNLGILNLQLSNYSEAKNYSFKALKINKKIGDSAAISNNMANIAKIYKDENIIDSALYFLWSSFNISKKRNDWLMMANSLTDIANIKKNSNDYENALLYFEQSKMYNLKIDNKIGIAYNYLGISKIYIKTNKNLNIALEYLRKADTLAKNSNNMLLIVQICENFKDYYIQKKDVKKALKYSLLYNKYSDSIYARNLTDEIAKMESRNEIINKFNLQTQKTKESEKNQLFLIALSILILVIAIILFLLYRIKSNTNKTLNSKNEELGTTNILLNESEHKLKELNSTKDKLVAIISHDLRSPVASFKQMLDIFSLKFHKIDDNSRTIYINNLRDSSNKVYLLLDNLLNWSKINLGHINFNPEENDLNNIINSEISLLTESINKKNIKIQFNSEIDKDVFCDENLISVIVRNLLSNAIKYSPINNEIFVNATNYDGKFHIFVKDFGKGIDNDTINKILMAEHIESEMGTSNEKGNGLGLLIVKELTEKHYGKLNINSEKGKYTEMEIEIPFEIKVK
jgi:signal transduction histidine kinase